MPGIEKPILLEIPAIIESARLIIRAPRPGDGPAVHAAIEASLAELAPWMPFANGRQTAEQTEIYLRNSATQFAARERLPLLIFRKADDAFVGATGLERIDWTIPRFEIGYWQATAMSGQGYITETVERLVQFCFETLHAARVEIHCDVRNERSAAVARRAGFKQEGCLRDYRRDVQGELSDELVFGMTAADYAERTA